MVINSCKLIYETLYEIVAYASFTYLICFGINTEWRKKMLQCETYFLFVWINYPLLSSFRAFD